MSSKKIKPSAPNKKAARKTTKPALTKQSKAGAGKASQKTGHKQLPKKPQVSVRKLFVCGSFELLGLAITAATGITVLLGHTAAQFSGTDFFSHLLPFIVGVLAMILAFALLLIGWMRMRRWLQHKTIFLPAACSLILALISGALIINGDFFFAFNQFKILIGGKEEASRASLGHQVFAAYRRLDTAHLRQLIDRSKPFSLEINAAAEAFALDPDLLHGLAATESSFLPRESKDGGQGLFQITQIPATATLDAARHLGVVTPLITDQAHNGFLAAATLSHYLKQMKGDLFLGLLAYNIGPKNGGLRFIMQQYGATDFITIQPYLQQLPRDYPIRVLCTALAFRIFHKEGRLLAYEEGLNAMRIQHIGIPGL